MKVLIADDEAIIRMGLKSMLQELGHSVFAAKNGKDALQQAQRYQPDIAILDIRMPYMDGLDVAKTLHNRSPIPIIILTGDANKLLLEKATSVPFQAHLIKPIRSTSELLAAMAVATKVFREQQEATKRQLTAETRLVDQKKIDRARTMLMEQGMSEQDAYRQLQQTARSSGKPMRDIADETILICQANAVLKKKRNESAAQAQKHLEQSAYEQGISTLDYAEEIVLLERAVQALVKETGITQLQAERFIAQRAMEANRPKRDIARAIVKNASK